MPRTWVLLIFGPTAPTSRAGRLACRAFLVNVVGLTASDQAAHRTAGPSNGAANDTAYATNNSALHLYHSRGFTPNSITLNKDL